MWYWYSSEKFRKISKNWKKTVILNFLIWLTNNRFNSAVPRLPIFLINLFSEFFWNFQNNFCLLLEAHEISGLGSRRWNWKFREKNFWNPRNAFYIFHNFFMVAFLLSPNRCHWLIAETQPESGLDLDGFII